MKHGYPLRKCWVFSNDEADNQPAVTAAAGTARKNVARQLRLREEKNTTGTSSQPTAKILNWSLQIIRQAIFFPSTTREPIPRVPRCERDPRHERESSDRNVVPERLGMVVRLLEKRARLCSRMNSRKKLWISHLDRHVPRQGNYDEEQNPGQPEMSRGSTAARRASRLKITDDRWPAKKGATGPLASMPKCHAHVEREQISALLALAPRPPGKHAYGEGGSQ